MGVDTASRTPFPASRSPVSGDNQSAHAAHPNPNPVPTAAELTSLFDEAMKRAPGTGDPDPATGKPAASMSKDEQTKFLKAMGDPEFRSLLNDYMLEIADPANRAETEQYLAQLEREQKVPEDKTLIKPTPGFVVKTKWTSGDGGETKKMFVNICSSEKLQPPSSTKVESGPRVGTSWSLPYSVGPERTEPDKSGASRVVTYDVCFHPRTLQFATTQKQYRDMVVKTCLDAVEPLVRKSQSAPDVVVSRDYHVLKGVLYKSGEPVTMCLTTPLSGTDTEKAMTPTNRPAQETVKAPQKSERLEPKVTSQGAEENHTKILHESHPSKKPLIEEVTAPATKTEAKAESPPKPLPKLEFRVVYRGKFEMLDHMQATLNSHETPAQLPNRPRELVVEISFPNHSSAKGIDLDVNDRAVKVETAGYQPLEVQLPFAVIEEKGSAKFDKKARKLVVTLPVQPPEPAPVKRMAIVEQEEEEEEESAATAKVDEQTKTHDSRATTSNDKPSCTTKDDAFAMLRETAMMVANDPMYLPREEPVAESKPSIEEEKATRVTPETDQTSVSLDDKVNAHVANDKSYDDLPPLESCSEDEDDIEMDLHDMLAMDVPAAQSSLDTQDASTTDAMTEPSTDGRILRQSPLYTTKETAACLSYLVEVAQVDSGSVNLEFPSKASFVLQFSTHQEHFELRVDDFGIAIDTARSEFHVATDNLVVILHKAGLDAPTQAEQLARTTAPPPVVRFQNDLLYDID